MVGPVSGEGGGYRKWSATNFLGSLSMSFEILAKHHKASECPCMLPDTRLSRVTVVTPRYGVNSKLLTSRPPLSPFRGAPYYSTSLILNIDVVATITIIITNIVICQC